MYQRANIWINSDHLRLGNEIAMAIAQGWNRIQNVCYPVDNQHDYFGCPPQF